MRCYLKKKPEISITNDIHLGGNKYIWFTYGSKMDEVFGWEFMLISFPNKYWKSKKYI